MKVISSGYSLQKQMREMIFNEASVTTPAASLNLVAPMLADIAKGMALLTRSGAANPTLRMRIPWHDLMCAPDGSLFDAVQILRRRGDERDAVLFLLKLAVKVPLLTELPTDVVGRFRGCEPLLTNSPEGDCLVLCAHISGISVSLPITTAWDVDQLEVRFSEILGDGSIVEGEESVDNIARPEHAAVVADRARNRDLEIINRDTFWPRRHLVFPRLSFGMDVEDLIHGVEVGVFPSLVRRIDQLHSSALDWDRVGGPAPPWRCRVTPESETTMTNEKLRDARIFRDAAGVRRLYEWHARFGSAGRIHLRFAGATKLLEIGYIGQHLPLQMTS